MSDFLLELSKNPKARKAIKTLGLPVPLPPRLGRAKTPMVERPLHDERVLVGAAPGATTLDALAETLTTAGAWPQLVEQGGADLAAAFSEPGEAYGRLPNELELDALAEAEAGLRGLIFDATGISTAAGLRAVYDFLNSALHLLERGGRVVVIGRPPQNEGAAEGAAAQAALEGLTRSLGKEIGRKGSTANLLVVEAGAEARIAGPLRFLLSRHSAFVTCQPLRITSAAAQPEAISWTRPLEGKVALVTGAARGIGAATARRLADEGAHVVCLDRPADDVALSRLARDLGGTPLLVDITDEDAAAKIAAAVVHRGGLDVIVHNAGVTRDKTLARMKPEAWDMVLDINLAAVNRITEALLEETINDQAHLICLSSVAGIAGNVGQTNYAASKAGLIGFVGALAAEVAERGITANAVAPGFIETRMTAKIPTMIREAGRRLSALGQGGLPLDVAELITFLATPGAAGVTGQTIRVCGGALIGA